MHSAELRNYDTLDLRSCVPQAGFRPEVFSSGLHLV